MPRMLPERHMGRQGRPRAASPPYPEQELSTGRSAAALKDAEPSRGNDRAE